MNTAYLLTGGNMGVRQDYLQQAQQLLGTHCGTIRRASAIYETAAWGNTGQASFLNQALELETSLNAKQLIRRVLKLEKMMGRVREEKYGPRIIDIDILLFNHEKYQYSFLNVPHPEMQNRRFVLVPLAEIAPGFFHPVLEKTITELLAICPDTLGVHKWQP
ncbi:MAG: 2-amino-4-hydroxy-6-hydroxymethyldihydropteridine diphosphokinase [Bacteroidetes bacterium]|nr:2-amino-4-hydroxy-6-hydroxymethyldihydropteridine diphosphokinase [Bacteroidota bacterium]